MCGISSLIVDPWVHERSPDVKFIKVSFSLSETPVLLVAEFERELPEQLRRRGQSVNLVR